MSWDAFNLAALHDVERPEPTLGGIVYPGLRTLLSGEPESLKSWLAAVIATHEVRAGRPVVWVDFEQGAAMTRSRFKDLGLTDTELAHVIYFEPREPMSAQARDELRDVLAVDVPVLAVFDAYAGLIGLEGRNPNNEQDIEAVNRSVIDVFRDTGAGIILLDHPVKNTAERGRYSSGSARKLAEADVHVRLERGATFGRGKTGTSRLVTLKDRPGGMTRATRIVTLTSDPTSGRVTAELAAASHEDGSDTTMFRPTGLMERVSAWLSRQTEPASRNTIEREVKGKGEFVRLAIDVLTREGYALETLGPRDARLVSHVRNYHEHNDLVSSSPPRPNPVPDEDDDFVPRPLSLGRDEDEVEVERLAQLARKAGA